MGKGSTEVYHGNEKCREKLFLLLTVKGLPDWLMPLEVINEFGYVPDTGYVWLKLKKSKKVKLEEIGGQDVSYDSEITAYVSYKTIKNLTGIKAKELLIWVTVSEIHVDHSSKDTITFKIPSGISKTFKIE